MSTILIVDDSPVSNKIISGLLATEYKVIVANDGQTAIQIASDQKPDLILLDIIMPKMDGLAVCRFLKSQKSTREIPIIFITLVSEAKEIVKAFEAGGQDYITKPFCSEELRARIKTHLDLRKSKDALKLYALELEAKNRELKEMLVKLEITATTDYLTNLSNRRYMMKRINDEVARVKLTQDKMVLVMADIDNFKRVNDTYGHECGDLVLRDVAGTMKSSMRVQDLIARWGGEEFLLMLPGTDYNEGWIAAEKLRKAIAGAKSRYLEKEISVTVTLGVAEFDVTMSIDENIKRADDALYEKRNCGRQ